MATNERRLPPRWFLEFNGVTILHPRGRLKNAMIRIASGKMSKEEFAKLLRRLVIRVTNLERSLETRNRLERMQMMQRALEIARMTATHERRDV